MTLLVGLGNVGSEYEATRHNAGFMVVSRLAERHAVEWRPFSLSAIYGDWKARPLIRLLKPLTMMNVSGGVVIQGVQDWRVAAEELLIVCDDVNLPLGRLRLRPQGSAGGHHGLLSCLDALGTEDVARLRVGVGREPLPRDLTEFVLSPFAKDEQPVLERAVRQAVEACEMWATRGMTPAMNQVNKVNAQ